jgi:hypothetical protein
MKYVIRPGIAACATIHSEAFLQRFGCRSIDMISMEPGHIVSGLGESPVDIPDEVRDAYTKHFDKVFSLPYEDRQAYLDTVPEIVVEVPHG